MTDFIKENNITIKNDKIYYTDLKTKEKIVKDLNIDLKKIHSQLTLMNYEEEYEKTKRIKDPVMENYKMIQFAFVFYYFFAENLKIPSPKELVDKYLELFCIRVSKTEYTFKEEYLYDDNIVFEKNALAARMLRAYNSYNREIEFFMNMKEKFEDAEIEYDLVEDLHNGIDLIVRYEGKIYGIATYVKTPGSLHYKNKKNTNRHDYSNINMIDVVAVMHGKDKNVTSFGDTYTYKTNVVYDVANKIMEDAL